MIIFEDIEWKNLLSTGNNPTKIYLNRSESTLVVGHNGAGKSTLLDALSFGLFGKPHRAVSKNQLINSVNKKGCLVTINFKVDSHTFKVIRGIKPNIFEIWQNGNMINQNSTSRDYQKLLEQTILKFNHKSFHQIIVLGSSSFVPFMQLPAWSRREIIEDLLDIKIFSVMKEFVKTRLSTLREEINDNKYQYDLIIEKLKLKNSYIADITRINDDIITEKTKQVADLESKLIEHQRSNNTLLQQIETVQPKLETELKELNTSKLSIVQEHAKINQKIQHLVKEVKFYEVNDNCPTCHQDIDPVLKTTKVEEGEAKAKVLFVSSEENKTQESENKENIASITESLNEVYEKQKVINTNINYITSFQNQIEEIDKQIADLDSSGSDSTKAVNELNELKDDRRIIEDKKYALQDDKLYNEAIFELLKDTGIKTKIIKQYLPTINKLVNNFLQVMDFFVSFDLDETFSEVIRSRHRDNFTYESFSEGEKSRLDLSLLFTWRQIAKMKNSVSCNLLILDETFDSSLDYDGVENLTKILNTFDTNTNIFIISHKGDVLENKFRNKIEFIKDKNFSKIV